MLLNCSRSFGLVAWSARQNGRGTLSPLMVERHWIQTCKKKRMPSANVDQPNIDRRAIKLHPDFCDRMGPCVHWYKVEAWGWQHRLKSKTSRLSVSTGPSVWPDIGPIRCVNVINRGKGLERRPLKVGCIGGRQLWNEDETFRNWEWGRRAS